MIKTQELFLNMGPQHPATHGVFRVVLKLDGEKIVDAVPHIGYLHRNFEKIVENRTYEQITPFTDRLDYVSSMLGNWGYVRAVEELEEIPVPERAEYIRVMVGELNRIASHLITFGMAGMDTGAFTIFLYCMREREKILNLFEKLCGARLTCNYVRIGGVASDLPEGFVEETKEFLDYFESKTDEYENLLLKNYIFKKRCKGVGILSKKDALNFGASGPVLRASGVKWDLRKNDTYSVYSEFDFRIPMGKNGDSWDRSWVRLQEMRESAKIIRQALGALPHGEIRTEVPRNLRLKPGEIYSHIESPRGELGFYLVSDGGEKPYRLKVRSPAFSNLSLTPLLFKGHQISDVVVILGSLDPVFGEVDR